MAAVLPLQPADASTAAAMLARAAAEGTRVSLEGSRTKLSVDSTRQTISSARLTAGFVHYDGDLVATVPAGSTLREVNAALALHGQWIPIDPPHAARATIGGIVAANDSGPRRHGLGAPRDLIIGIEVALTTGQVARGGGRVVKNVAGYDLGRLFCGSRGSLGMITAVNFKLTPVPVASRTVVARFAGRQQALAAALELARSPALTPSALELVVPDIRLLVRFETTARSAALMADAAAVLLARDSSEVVVLDGAAEEAAWDSHQRLESAPDGLAIAAIVLPTRSETLLNATEQVAASCAVAWSATGRAALGIWRLRLAGSAAQLTQAAATIRTAAVQVGGHAQCVGGDALEHVVDPLGPIGSVARIASAVKQRFDPAGVLPLPWTS